jgi:CRISPR-associated protein Cas2
LILLLSFDLPRNTRDERKQAAKYQKRLVELGFMMKQFSLYEREVVTSQTRQRLIEILQNEIPDTGLITLYQLPDSVNDQQITILGDNAVLKSAGRPQLIVI